MHTALIAERRRILNRLLPDGLVARAEERLVIDSEGEAELHASPDVTVYSPSIGPMDKSGNGTLLIEAPYKVVVRTEPITERFVRIETQNGKLIAIIEVFSPSNKRQPGLGLYVERRNEFLEAGVHVVEIDLVRTGDWKALFLPHKFPAAATSLYRVTVRVAESPAPAYIYPIDLRDTLPDIHMPLRVGDPKVMLPLQSMIETIYTDGRYGRTIDYKRPPDPPLSAEDSTFVTDKLAAAR